MIVYHGSSQVVRMPDPGRSYKALDFGQAFYVTTVRAQAERWAKRKADLSGDGHPVVNIYRMLDIPQDYRVKRFDEDLREWIDFVCRCRDGEDLNKDLDLVIGRVADDKVFRVVDMYRNGIWDKDRAIREIRAYENYDQIAFVSPRSVAELLSFDSYYEP